MDLYDGTPCCRPGHLYGVRMDQYDWQISFLGIVDCVHRARAQTFFVVVYRKQHIRVVNHIPVSGKVAIAAAGLTYRDAFITVPDEKRQTLFAVLVPF